jgi:SAM-dependent methyltransferase
MQDLDFQIDYWDRIGPSKPFAHPVNLARLKAYLDPACRILDFGCGYGRVAEFLFSHGYRNVVGVDPAPAMVAAARDRLPELEFHVLDGSLNVGVPDASVDAVLLFSVLTCVPGDAGQRAIVQEVTRVLAPGGLLYISDLWLQTDRRNIERYEAGRERHGTYGVFDLPEGVTVRHHDRRWIEELTGGFARVTLDELQLPTMNFNTADGFQWFGRKASEAPPQIVEKKPRESTPPR